LNLGNLGETGDAIQQVPAAVLRTRVVNVKHEECDVYIGRAMAGRQGSRFRNLLKVGVDGTREQVIARYRTWLLTQPELLKELQSYRGLRLGCWCYPLVCHGDVLVEILEGPALASPKAAQLTLF
jgi:hypothetical protein